MLATSPPLFNPPPFKPRPTTKPHPSTLPPLPRWTTRYPRRNNTAACARFRLGAKLGRARTLKWARVVLWYSTLERNAKIHHTLNPPTFISQHHHNRLMYEVPSRLTLGTSSPSLRILKRRRNSSPTPSSVLDVHTTVHTEGPPVVHTTPLGPHHSFAPSRFVDRPPFALNASHPDNPFGTVCDGS
jgi:hypothetical protein